MDKLLNEIQTELADITASLDKGDVAGARNGLHYLHAFIESHKGAPEAAAA